MMCANAHQPMDPGMARRLFAKSSRSQYCRPLQSPRLATKLRTTIQHKTGFSKHSSAFAGAAIGSLRCSSRRVFVLLRIVFFASWIVIFLAPVPGRFHCPKGARCVLAPVALLISLDNTALPILSFPSINSFVDCLAEGVPVCVNQRRSPPLKVLSVDEGPLCAPHQLSTLTRLLLP